MKRIISFVTSACMIFAAAGMAHAQITRVLGAQSLVLDNNDLITTNNVYFIQSFGSLGIANSSVINGSYPNTTALLSLLAGSKTTNLRIDGGSVWGIDVVNTNNSIRTSGSNIFGDGIGNDATTVNLGGTGNLTLNGVAAPALPSPLSNLLYLNASNQVQQTPGGVNIISGSGTLNTVPLWTPNGNQLGNSILTQPTTSTMAITPSGPGTNVLTVNNFNATSTAIKINANGGTGINVDPASTGISLQATNTGINFASAPTTGINLQAITTGMKVNGLASTAFGISIDMTTNPVTPLGASVLFGQISGASGTNVFGGNINAFSTNASCTGFGCTTNVTGTGNTNGVFAAASTNGSGSVNGVLGSATGTGGASGQATGGVFSATGGASSATIFGVTGFGTSANASTAFGGSFGAAGSSTTNIGVSAGANSAAAGQNVAVDATASGANSVGVRTGAFNTPTTGVQVLSATTTGVGVTSTPTMTRGVNVDMTTNPVSTFQASGLSATVTGTSGNSVNGANLTVNSSGNLGGATGIFSSATSTGSGAPVGINATATAIGAGATNGVVAGQFSATGAANTAQTNGVVSQVTATNANSAIAGIFQAVGSSGQNIGVEGIANGGSGQNISFQATATGPTSIAYQVINAPGTAFTTPTGNIILGSTVNTIASGGTIPAGWTVVDVNDNGVAASPATVVLPGVGVNGQICYITTDDPDGVKISVGLASVTLSNSEVGTFMIINGTWRIQH